MQVNLVYLFLACCKKVQGAIGVSLTLASMSHFKVLQKSFLCDGQGTVWGVILYVNRSYFFCLSMFTDFVFLFKKILVLFVGGGYEILLTCSSALYKTQCSRQEGGNRDNLRIIFHIFPSKHRLFPLIRTISLRQF